MRVPTAPAVEEALRAIDLDDSAELADLLRAGLSPDAADSSGARLLHRAAEGARACLRLLLDRGADPSAALPDGRTPGMRAAARCPACLGMLLEARPFWGAVDAEGRSALHHAACGFSPASAQCARLLAQAAPSALFRAIDARGLTPLASACKLGLAEQAAALFSRSDPLDLNPSTGRDALAYALEYGHAGCAALPWPLASLERDGPDGRPMIEWARASAARRPGMARALAPLIARFERAMLDLSCLAPSCLADGRPAGASRSL